MMATLALKFLRTFQAIRDGTSFRRFRSDKIRALLAYLSVEADHRALEAIIPTIVQQNTTLRVSPYIIDVAHSTAQDVQDDMQEIGVLLRTTQQQIQIY